MRSWGFDTSTESLTGAYFCTSEGIGGEDIPAVDGDGQDIPAADEPVTDEPTGDDSVAADAQDAPMLSATGASAVAPSLLGGGLLLVLGAGAVMASRRVERRPGRHAA